MNMTKAEAYLTQVDNQFTVLPYPYSCTFAIYPVPAHSPIAKEHSYQPTLALSGYYEIPPLQIWLKLS